MGEMGNGVKEVEMGKQRFEEKQDREGRDELEKGMEEVGVERGEMVSSARKKRTKRWRVR